MAKVAIADIKTELVVFLRNQNILSTATRGVTTTSDTFTISGGATTVTLAQTTVKNVRSVTKNAAALSYKNGEYTVNYSTAVVTIPTAVNSDVIVVQYDYGTTDRIFPDYPQAHLKRNDFPRVSVDIVNGNSRYFELGAATTVSDYLGYVICYDVAQSNVETMVDAVRSAFITEMKNFKLMSLAEISGIGPRLQSEFGELKCFQRNVTLNIPAIHES